MAHGRMSVCRTGVWEAAEEVFVDNRGSVVSCMFLYIPFMVRLAHHERNKLNVHALRQACHELVEGHRVNGQCQRMNEALN